jgi:predicted ATPase
MLKKLRLERFKNFRDAELLLGPFTVLVGQNATGKSNIRDAFRFLHGIGRGYTLPEIVGEKFEAGSLAWTGVRGGAREIAFAGAKTFAVEMTFTAQDQDNGSAREATYRIEVEVLRADRGPQVIAERLVVEGEGDYIFDAERGPGEALSKHALVRPITVRIGDQDGHGSSPTFTAPRHRPVLSQLVESLDARQAPIATFLRQTLQVLSSMRFFEFEGEAMRRPSVPGLTVLGDRGENLSSVLQAICDQSDQKRLILSWLEDLLPADVRDLEFPADARGHIVLSLVERGGRRISADSASNGTLRYLAMLAALLGPEPAKLNFIEEIENGIHPTRLYQLTQLIETYAKKRLLQVVATTHSPQFLGMLRPPSIDHVSVTYRLEGADEARIKRILDIPTAPEVLQDESLLRLQESGWFEDILHFSEHEVAKA